MKYYRNESHLQIEPYVFCNHNISNYEKTIYVLAIAYGAAPIYHLEKGQIQDLAMFLEVDFELLSKALKNEGLFTYGKAIIKFGSDKIDCGKYFNNTFFDVIIKIFFMYKNLDEIFDGVEEEEIIENIRVFNTITFLFDTANAGVATYECMEKKAFSYDNTLYDSAECFRPKDYINMLTLLVTSEDCLEYDKGLLKILTMILKYEFSTRINALYLVTICQILKHSPCFDIETKNVASEIYNKLLFILKNGKVISINVNMLFRKTQKPIDERTKKDNTTRLQLLYGYSNYDCYDLRLDFAHKGQEIVHFNNETPGGLSCCIFTKQEYEVIIDKYPKLKECFICYENRWALKEKNNCELSKETRILYDKVSKDKAHDPIFSQIYSEEVINGFINVVSKMLPPNCQKAIDTDSTYAKYCFNYDVIMRDTILLYLAYLTRDNKQVDMVAEWIADKAFRYGLTSKKLKLDTFDKVAEIVKVAKERIV